MGLIVVLVGIKMKEAETKKTNVVLAQALSRQLSFVFLGMVWNLRFFTVWLFMHPSWWDVKVNSEGVLTSKRRISSSSEEWGWEANDNNGECSVT